MSDIREITFKLTHPITYHSGAEAIEAYELIMKSPTMASYRFVTALKEGLFKKIDSLKDQAKEVDLAESKAPFELTGKAIIGMLYAKGDLDVYKYLESFKELCLAGSVVLPNNAKLTQVHINSMSPQDYEDLAGEYIKNFLIGSLLANASAK